MIVTSSLPLSDPFSISAQFFTARSALPLSIDNVWQIQSGVLRSLTWLEDGSTVILGIWGVGDLIGKPLTKTDPYQVECITNAKVVPISLAQLPNLSEVLLEHVYQIESLMQIRSHKRVDIMLVKLFDWLAKRFGQEVAQGRLIDLRLTHLDLAEAIGTTRVTVTRTLKQLEQQGVIECLPLKRFIVHEDELWHYEI